MLELDVSAPFLVGKMLGYPYPLDEATYLLLRQSRKATTSGTTPPAISRVAVLTWLQQVHDWMDSLPWRSLSGTPLFPNMKEKTDGYITGCRRPAG